MKNKIKRVRDERLSDIRHTLMVFSYQELLLTMGEVSVVFGTTKQNVSKILKKVSDKE